MKHRDVVLDFTSLLDIILIILFFFILYSVFDVERAAAEAGEVRAQYEEELGALEAEREELEAERAALEDGRTSLAAEREELEGEWERLAKLDGDAAGNQRALSAFGEGGMLTFILQKEDGDERWTLRAVRRNPETGRDERLAEIIPGGPGALSGQIEAAFALASFAEDDTVLASFVYDGDVLGSNKAYAEVMEAFGELRDRWRKLYLNAVNLSR